MPWTNPPTEVTGYTVTATDWNNYISANPLYLYGDTAWTTVSSFSNAWVAGSPAPAYILIGRVVYLRGELTSGTGATAAFTLPAGYRPSAQTWVATVATPTTTNLVSIAPTGVVTPQSTANSWLSGVSFPVV